MPKCGLSDEVRLFLTETGAEISVNPANKNHDTPEFKKAWSFLRVKMLEAALKHELCSQLGSSQLGSSQLGSSQQPEPTVVHVQVSTYSDVHFTLGRINRSLSWSLLDFERLSESLRNNFCVVYASIERDARIYWWLSYKMRNDRRLALAAATKDASCLRSVPAFLQTDPEIVLAAMKHGMQGRSICDILKWLPNDTQQKVKDIVASAGLRVNDKE